MLGGQLTDHQAPHPETRDTAASTVAVASDGPSGRLRIAAVVPALNEALSIEKVVRGLLHQSSLPLDEVIVVDNRSTDGTGEIARAAGATVIVEPRRGYGAA